MTQIDARPLVDSDFYSAHGAPHDLWTRLRAESPVHWCDHELAEPYWAITRHADICSISKQPDVFLSEPGITIEARDLQLDRTQGIGAMRVVITMDPPEHRDMRKVASPWFTPRALKRIDAIVEESARSLVDELAQRGEADFAMEVAVRHPLRVLATSLGLSREQEPKILELSNRLFAPDDQDLGTGGGQEEFQKLGQEFLELFLPIIEDRRKHPSDDLASVIANARVNGEPLGPMETLGYYLIVFSAGHDTTKNALAGGFRALIEHPDEFAKLQKDPSRVPDAVEEIVRWASPVNFMKRTAACDTQVHGQAIKQGEAVVMYYGSANRDEEIFDDPFTFKTDRKPNRHIGFGHGEHFCMGSHFARRSMCALITQLSQRVEHWELAGEPEWIAANFVVGLKHLPVRYEIAKR